MDKAVALGYAPVWEQLHVRRAHQMLPPRERGTDGVKVVRRHVRRGGADVGREHRAGDTGDLQYPLLLRTEARNLRLNELAQTLRYPEVARRDWHLHGPAV